MVNDCIFNNVQKGECCVQEEERKEEKKESAGFVLTLSPLREHPSVDYAL